VSGGRPPLGENKRKPIKVRLSPAERQQLEQEAKAADLRLAVYMRRKLLS
jgi:hypothetical protein